MSGVYNIVGNAKSAVSAVVSAFLSGWDSTDDSAAPSTGVSVNGTAYDAQKTAVNAGDAVKAVFNLFGEIVVAGYTWATQSVRIEEINPARFSALPESLIDVANLPIGTHYYPSPNGADVFGVQDFSYTGKIDDPDGTITITFEATNDEDLIAGTWPDITLSGYRSDINQTNQSSITVTDTSQTFAMDFDNINKDRIRVKVVNDGATNAVSVKQRKDI